jgi:hypothetical protein
MVNRCNKDNAVLNKPLHAEVNAGKNPQVTTKPEVLQALLGSPNMQGNTASITNTSDEAL